MKINRWILFPLIIILGYVLPAIILGETSFKILFWIIWGAIAGFAGLYWSDSKARKVTGSNNEEIYNVRQKRNLTVLLDYRKAFEISKEAVNSLNLAKIKVEDFESGVIEFRTRINWHSFGYIIKIKIRKINDHLTEIEINTRPIKRTAIVGSGYSWKYIEDICAYLKEKDAEINKKVLVDSTSILDDVYVKPFQKEKVER